MNKRLVAKHIFFFISALIIIVFVWKCPLRLITGIPCPACGLTRAYLAAARFDFLTAFCFHPLFPLAAPLALWCIHINVIHRRFKVDMRAQKLALATVAVLFFGVWIYRVFICPGDYVYIDFHSSLIYKITENLKGLF